MFITYLFVVEGKKKFKPNIATQKGGGKLLTNTYQDIGKLKSSN
jgi:hypothetical protein